MKIGYARTSTLEQEAGLQSQIKELKAAGCEKVFKEQVSSVGPRAQLESVLEFIREGDTLTVTKLDRLARSTPHLWKIVTTLQDKGAFLKILNLGIDTANATGKLVLTIMGGIAEFEREMMLERQKEGIAKAKADGRYKGRKPTAKAQAKEVLALHKQGKGPTEITKALKISRASVYRILDGKKSSK